MSSMRELLVKNRRLAFLRFLADAPGYNLNTSVMQSALAAIGHGVSRDVVDGDAAWLAEQGLVTLERLELAPITVCTITTRGSDVASGVASHPGVDRPQPRG